MTRSGLSRHFRVRGHLRNAASTAGRVDMPLIFREAVVVIRTCKSYRWSSCSIFR